MRIAEAGFPLPAVDSAIPRFGPGRGGLVRQEWAILYAEMYIRKRIPTRSVASCEVGLGGML